MNVSWLNLSLVGLGGSVGAALRFIVGAAVSHVYGPLRYPLATTCVNVSGCFLIGFLNELMLRRGGAAPEWSLFLVTGVLGGFTTFSAFGFEVFSLLRAGDVSTGVLAAALQVILGLGAVYAGIRCAALLA